MYLSKIETMRVLPIDTVMVISRLALVLKENITPKQRLVVKALRVMRSCISAIIDTC